MLPSPLRNGKTPRANPTPAAPDPAVLAKPRSTAGASTEGNSGYIAYRPSYARSLAGNETPPSLAYSRLGSASQSKESLLPVEPEPPSRSKGAIGTELPLQDLIPGGKPGRRAHPVDPSIQAVTSHGSLVGRDRMENVPLMGPDSPRPSTDEVGLPLPVTSGKGKKSGKATAKTFRETVREEEQAIRKKSKRAGIAAAATLLAITAAGATVSTLKTAGKL